MFISAPMPLCPCQMSTGMETHHFQPFPVVHGPNPDHDLIFPLYVVLALWHLFQSIERGRFSYLAYHNRSSSYRSRVIWACEIWRKSLFISETVRDRPTVTMELYYEAMGAGLNSIIFEDLEWPLTRVSRSLYTSKSNNLKTGAF